MSAQPYNAILTKFARERSMGAGGVGTRLFPLIESETGLTGEYAVYPRKRGIEEIDPKRARGAKVKVAGIEDFTMEPFRLTDHTVDVQVPFEDTVTPNLQNAQILNKFDRGAAKAQRIIMTAHERAVYNKVWAANKGAFEAIYSAAHVSDAAAKWDVTGSKIKQDALKAKARIYDSTGKVANTALIPDDVYNKFIGANNELRDTLKHVIPGGPSLQYLAAYLEVEQVIVPQFLVDSANSGQAENFGKLWNSVDAVGFFHISPNPTNLDDTLGGTFYRDGAEAPFMGVSTEWDRAHKSWMARCEAYFDVKMIDNLCGAIVWDVL